MLDTETRKRIDTARDVLVGKVPDPKSQVEQITIALIYKFMDDMDKMSVEMGGKPGFFAGEFEQYSWTNIFNPKLGGFEMLGKYSEAIEKMNTNPNIPQLFRDIFKNAYLPYRDPETLRLFLKTISEFTYDHSEKLGDAFEYLLSVLGSQGDAGQFRTPRHIIDFIVDAVDPKKDDRILDPACGTAGFLISSYKHIMASNTKKVNGDLLKGDEKNAIVGNLTGYDISPDMVRLSLANMYLHGFPSPNIVEYDTLTSTDKWDSYWDVILANPPFMSPKGGIRPHDRFQVQCNRSEVLFVDYIAEHLSPGGRAGVIVPEGIIFQSANAYKSLRKYLVESNFLYAVVSLPAGVFQPYSGVKTSILLMDKHLASKTDKILFVKIATDGFDLGAQRKAIDKNDLPQALKVIYLWKQAIIEGKTEEFDKELKTYDAIAVAKDKLASNDYNLSAERYRDNGNLASSKWPMVELRDIVQFVDDGDWIESKDQSDSGIRLIQTGNIGISCFIDKADKSRFINEATFEELNCTEIFPGDVLVSRLPDPVGRSCLLPRIETRSVTAVDVTILRFMDKITSKFFVFNTLSKMYQESIDAMLTGSTRPRISKSNLVSIKIPLPTMEVQKKIVEEIEGYQKIIDGARQVVDNWKPRIDIDPSWPLVKLGDLCSIRSGSTPNTNIKEYYENGTIPWLKSEVCKDDIILEPKSFISELGFDNSSVKFIAKFSTLIALVGATIGKTGLILFDTTTNQNIAGLTSINKNELNDYYLFYSCQALYNEFIALGDKGFKMANLSFLKSLLISLPPLQTQQEIVDKIEAERKAVDGCRELIRVYEAKIKHVIDSLWS